MIAVSSPALASRDSTAFRRCVFRNENKLLAVSWLTEDHLRPRIVAGIDGTHCVMERIMRALFVISLVAFLATSVFAQPQSRDKQTVTVGPWAIATTYKAGEFDNCTMSRSTGGLEISFVRTQDGLLVVLDSQKWKLDRGNAYSVKLAAGSQSVDAKALAETKSVTIALADRRFNSKLRSATVLEVHGKGATLRVPLDGSRAALERLDECFEKNSRAVSVITNPFVAPSQKP
jgi:hypothetical protein